jgi:hypothetical protein
MANAVMLGIVFLTLSLLLTRIRGASWLGIEMIPRLQRSRILVPKTWAVGPRFYIARLRRFPFLEPVRQFLLPPDLSFIAS